MNSKLKMLNNLYYNTKLSSAFTGKKNIWKIAKKEIPSLTYKEFITWLTDQRPYTLHKQVRRSFKRTKIVAKVIDEQWQADLVDLKEYSNSNDGYKYLLNIIDVLSRYAWVIPLKNKTGNSVSEALSPFIPRRKPAYFQTDKGKEFYNESVKQFLKKHEIHHFSTENSDIKCAIVERFNRTLKNRMFRYFTHKDTKRYIDVVSDLVKAYNNTVHRSIKMKPTLVTVSNQAIVFKTLYGSSTKAEMISQKFLKKHKVSEGDFVRITFDRSNKFLRGYHPQWKEEIFQVDKPVKKQQHALYKLKDSEGENIKGTFYENEVQRIAKPKEFRIEKILDRQKRCGKIEYFVKWLGYPEKFNQWIPSTDITKLGAK